MGKSAWENLEAEVSASARRYSCKIGVLLDSVSGPARDSIQRVLDNPSYSANTIAKAFRERVPDMVISTEAITKHRKGECLRCGGSE